MGKLRLSKKRIKAVKDSVAHWKRDVLAKLKKGIKIKASIKGYLWTDNREEVLCYSKDCLTIIQKEFVKVIEENV